MKIFIAGIDGYLGWTLALYLAEQGHIVYGMDNCSRRKRVKDVGSDTAIPIENLNLRTQVANDLFYLDIDYIDGDLLDYDTLEHCLNEFKPDAIVHLGEMPSAPYSMISRKHCLDTMQNNVSGTLNLLYAMKEVCPDAHLLKLGTMGVYGTPNIPIPEGYFTLSHNGEDVSLPWPKIPGSWYHATKCHDTVNIELACKMWGLKCTDVMQGVVYGVGIPFMQKHKSLATRFDIDECFGTAINRFVAQAVIGHPLTIYGKGKQIRGFLPIIDSMQCFTLALNNPLKSGEYRVFNQFDESYSINELAFKIQQIGQDVLGSEIKINNYTNPRYEASEHFYKPVHEKLKNLGYKPNGNINLVIREMFEKLIQYKDHIDKFKDILVPNVQWHGDNKRAEVIR